MIGTNNLPRGTQIMVHSESYDWYLIPVDKAEDWEQNGMFADELPEYAFYISSPSAIEIIAYLPR